MSRWPDWRHRVPRILGVTLFLLGVVCVVEAFSAAFRHAIDPARGIIDSILLPTNGNLAYAAFVFLLAAAIARRKRIAWRILLFLMWLQVIGGLVIVVMVAFAPGELTDANGHTVDRVPYGIVNGIGLLVSVAVLVLLYASRREFYAPVRHASFRRALGVTVALLVVGTLVGWAIVAMFPGHLHGGTLTYLGYTAAKVLGGSGRFTPRSAGDTSGAVQLILGLFGAIAVIAGFATLLASQRAGAALPPEDERRIRKLLDADGERDSLGYFATRRDKSAVFSPSGKAAVTYRVVNDVSLASGDPIGDPEAWRPAVDEWLAQARRYAWVPAVMGASEEGAVAYRRAGLKVLELGDEAVLDVPSFTLDGREMRPVRRAVNRLERAGYTVRVARHDTLSEPEMAEVVRAANAWRDTDTERGFSMALGRLGDPTDGRCVLVEALDGHGGPVAMLSLSPWGRTGLSLDLMRRDRQADNGVMELMVTELIRAAPRLGVNRISLNFAVFRSVFEEGARIGAGPVLRAWRRVLLFFSRWWQLESLYRSNVKYQPRWVPRFLCLGERRELVKVGIASAIVEGFFAWPPWRKAAPLPVPAPAGTEALALLPEAGFPTDEGAGHDEVELPEQDRVRREKLEAIREAGIDSYPVGFARTHSLDEVAVANPGLPPDSRTGDRVGVAGRVLLIRDHGTRIFATLRDCSGDLQVMLEPGSLGPAGAGLDGWRRTVDLGDHVGVAGEVITTRRGELSVLADQWALTAKCLHPLPDKHRGVADPEAKVRRRYLDLITSPAARDVLRARSNAKTRACPSSTIPSSRCSRHIRRTRTTGRCWS